MTFTWIISSIECFPGRAGFADVVYRVHWQRECVDGIYRAEKFGVAELTLDPNVPFTPYEELTQEVVEIWLANTLGADAVQEIDSELERKVADLKNPPIVVRPLPW